MRYARAMRASFALLSVSLAIASWGAIVVAQDAQADADRTFQADRFQEAAEKYNRLTVADPNNAAAWYGLGKSYEALARQSFARLQALAPGSEWEALLVADVWVSAERFEQALSVYRDVLRLNPRIPGVHRSIATLYERAGKPEWAASESAKEPPQPVPCPAAAADCALLAGRPLDALASIGTRQDAPSLYWRIRALNDLALTAFSTLDALPPSAEVHMVRAAIDRDHGRAVDAVGELKAALALEPGNQAIEEELASALYESKNLDEALPLLARLAGPPETAAAAWAFFYGDALLQAQQGDRALPYLKTAARKEPDAPVVHASLGRALLQSGDAAGALPHLQAAAKADDPDSDGAIHYELAQAYQRLGRGAEAKQALTEYQKRQAAHAPDVPSAPDAPRPGLTPP